LKEAEERIKQAEERVKESARNLKKLSVLTDEQIASATGLSLETVKALL